jgi:hypothetical protein
MTKRHEEAVHERVREQTLTAVPWDAKHDITAGLDNEVMKTLLPYLICENKFDSAVTSVSSRNTWIEQ